MSVIWHLGAWNRNFGDWVLYDSIQHHLQESAGRALYFMPLDSQKTCCSERLIEKMNAEADMLIVGGGGLIFNRPEDNSVSGWQFNIRPGDIARIKVPLVVYGIGYNRFPYDPNDFPPVLDTHLRAVQDKAALFSVRNQGTYREVCRRGLDPEKTRIVTDAGVFAPCTPLTIPGLDPSRKTIGLNIAGDRPAHRFPSPAEENERLCYEFLAEALAQVVERENVQVLYLPHLVDIDDGPFAIFEKRLGSKNIVTLPTALPDLYPPAPATASFLIGAYDQCDAVIGMRGHACLIPYGRGVPFLGFGSHAKNSFLLEDTGFPDRRISTEAIIDGTLTTDETIAKITEALHNDERRQALRAARQQAWEGFQAWNRDVVGLISTGA